MSSGKSPESYDTPSYSFLSSPVPSSIERTTSLLINSTGWAATLQKYNQNHGLEGDVDEERDVRAKTFKIIHEIVNSKSEEEKLHPSFKVIPTFYKPRKNTTNNYNSPDRGFVRSSSYQSNLSTTSSSAAGRVDDDVAKSLALRKATRLSFLYRVMLARIDENEYQACQDAVATYSNKIKSKSLNYQQFSELVKTLPVKIKRMLSPHPAIAFSKLPLDAYGRCTTESLLMYIVLRTSNYYNRCLLAEFDSTGEGYLNEDEVINWIVDLMLKFPSSSRAIMEDTEEYYHFACMRKFFSVCRVYIRNQKPCVAIIDLLLSDAFLEFESMTRDPPREGSWFSVAKFDEVFQNYTTSDRDKDGFLSRAEFPLKYFNEPREKLPLVTTAVRDRIFEEDEGISNGKASYSCYLDFFLAYENLKTVNPSKPENQNCLIYWFKLFDYKRLGYIDANTVNYFYGEMILCLSEYDREYPLGFSIPTFRDVLTELFDIVHPKDKFKIYLSDVINCKRGELFVTFLASPRLFFAYEIRESVSDQDASSNPDAGEEELFMNQIPEMEPPIT